MYPEPLHTGDKIAIVSPSGKIDANLINGTKQILESWGLVVVPGPSAYLEYGRFAGSDQERLQDLQWALDDKNIRAILCSRGGYGLIRLAEKISLEGLIKNPKWLIGYSDVTVLHSIIQQTRIASIHAPMCSHFYSEGEDESVQILKALLFGKFPQYQLPSHPLNREGTGKGIVRGGNLSVLCSLRGSSYDIIPENTILFLEDVGERHYRLERMMYTLRLGGILGKLSGLIIGQFSDYDEDPQMDKSVYESIADMVSDYDFPVCFDFPVGHVKNNYPMICGASAELQVNHRGVFCKFTNN